MHPACQFHRNFRLKLSGPKGPARLWRADGFPDRCVTGDARA
jgi:hypothetical protein